MEELDKKRNEFNQTIMESVPIHAEMLAMEKHLYGKSRRERKITMDMITRITNGNRAYWKAGIDLIEQQIQEKKKEIEKKMQLVNIKKEKELYATEEYMILSKTVHINRVIDPINPSEKMANDISLLINTVSTPEAVDLIFKDNKDSQTTINELVTVEEKVETIQSQDEKFKQRMEMLPKPEDITDLQKSTIQAFMMEKGLQYKVEQQHKKGLDILLFVVRGGKHVDNLNSIPIAKHPFFSHLHRSLSPFSN
jgi:hypothetical protein